MPMVQWQKPAGPVALAAMHWPHGSLAIPGKRGGDLLARAGSLPAQPAPSVLTWRKFPADSQLYFQTGGRNYDPMWKLITLGGNATSVNVSPGYRAKVRTMAVKPNSQDAQANWRCQGRLQEESKLHEPRSAGLF